MGQMAPCTPAMLAFLFEEPADITEAPHCHCGEMMVRLNRVYHCTGCDNTRRRRYGHPVYPLV